LDISAIAGEDWEPTVVFTVKGKGDSCLRFSRTFNRESGERYGLSVAKSMVSPDGKSVSLALQGDDASRSCREIVTYSFRHPVPGEGFYSIHRALHPGMREVNLCRAAF
jgi:hypothetical protein